MLKAVFNDVLDLASGRGYGASILSEGNCKVFGLDLGRHYVKKAAEKYGKKAEFGAADVRELPIGKESVDGVTAFEITEHLEKRDGAGSLFPGGSGRI